jgi:hypothetical protein
MKYRVIKTDLGSIETLHAKHVAKQHDLKRLPYVEIHHDEENNKFHITTRGRVGRHGSPAPHSVDHPVHDQQSMQGHEFVKHVVKLHQDHPKMHPPPRSVKMTVKHNGHVDLKLGSKQYGMYDRTAKKVRAIHKQRDAYLANRDK